jgi:hypothetical protein
VQKWIDTRHGAWGGVEGVVIVEVSTVRMLACQGVVIVEISDASMLVCQGVVILEVSTACLFALDGLKECLEVSFSKRARAFALDDLVKKCGAIFDGFGEDLQEIAFFVAVDQDAEFAQGSEVFFDGADAIKDVVIIRTWDIKEFDAAISEVGDGLYDIVGGDGDVLNA